MLHITDYTIVSDTYGASVEFIVQKMIKDDWQPLGGAFYTTFGGTHQVMVKYEERNDANI